MVCIKRFQTFCPFSVLFRIYFCPVFSHSDGSVKFWDGSASTLQLLYKLKTNKVFEKPSSSSMRARWRSKSGTDGSRGQDDPFAVEHIYFCVDSRLLCVAGQDHVTLFRFSKQEVVTECSVSAKLHAMPVKCHVQLHAITVTCQPS